MKDLENIPHLTTKKLSQLTGLSPSFFEKARSQGRGPAYFKVGARVLYRQSDIERWLEKGRRAPEGSLDV